MERYSTGIPTFDEILEGGLPRGSTVLVVGRPGTGKTVLAHQVMFATATSDSRALYLTTLAEPQVKVMRFQQEFEFFDLDRLQNSVIYQDLGVVLRKHGPERALVVIDELLKKYEPSLLIIDTIKTIADMMPSLTDFRGLLLDLALRLATWGCTSLLLGEYSEEDIEVRPESAIADGIIYLSGTEERKQQKRFMRILKMRGTSYIGGEIMFRISGHGIDIFPRLTPTVSAQAYGQDCDRLSMGLSKLDEMTRGGLPRGTMTLLSGAAGTGKTSIALHFALAGLAAGEHVIYMTLEENPRQLIHSAKRLGIDLDRYIASGSLHIIHSSPVELDIDEYVHVIQRLFRETSATRLVVDSISAFELGMDDKVKYTDNIWALTDYLKTVGVTTLFTHEMQDHNSVSHITKHGMSFIADNLLVLRYVEEGLDIRRYVRVVKMRGSDHDTLLREIRIGENGLVID